MKKPESENYIRQSFFTNIFNKEYIHSSFNLCYDKDDNLIIPYDPIFESIKELKLGYDNNLPVLPISTDKEEIEEIKVELGIKPREKNKIDDLFNYSETIEILMGDKFLKYGYFRDFETLIRRIGMYYSISDEISIFLNLINSNELMKNMILLRNNDGGIIELEEKIMDNSLKYKDIKCNWKEICSGGLEIRIEKNVPISNFLNIEFLFSKEMKTQDYDNVLKLFYEADFYKLWLPSVSESKTISYLNKSKKTIYIKFSFPIFQERDLILYTFFVDKLDYDKSIEIYCKSYDYEETLINHKLIKRKSNVCRMDLKFFSLKLYFLTDNIRIEGIVNLDTKLKHINESFLEIFLKHYTNLLFSNIDKAIVNKKIKKNLININSKEFYDYYTNKITNIYKN